MVKLNIKNLERLLQIGEEKYISLITFNANANLKKNSTESENLYVIHSSQLKAFIKTLTGNPDILTSEEIENIYQKLLPGTKLGDAGIYKYLGSGLVKGGCGVN